MKADSAVARRFLLAGATLLPLGIALSAVGAKVPGAIVTLVAAAVLVAGVHTFGRAGPDLGEASRPDGGDPERR
jgi:hypothetical protein